jgi:hypothetical protein
MKDMPSLQSTNRFGCLEIEECDDSLDSPDQPEDMSENEKPLEEVQKKVKVPRWERRLPREFVLASTPSPRSFQIPVQLWTTDTQEVKAAKALLDCGASDLFLDVEYVKKECLNTRKLTNPIPINNVDGTPNVHRLTVLSLSRCHRQIIGLPLQRNLTYRSRGTLKCAKRQHPMAL